MTQTLPQVSREHNERLLLHVNQLPAMADLILTSKTEEVWRTVAEMSAFLAGTLVPHVDAAERTLYPELERMFQNRHSMAPMRREHTEIRRLVTDFAALNGQIDPSRVTVRQTLALRRVAFQLYALLKIHLAEEEAYLRIVDHGVTTDVGDLLAAAMDHPGILTN